MAAIHCEVIINDLLSELIMTILRESDLQADLDPAGIHQVLTEHCNRQPHIQLLAADADIFLQFKMAS